MACDVARRRGGGYHAIDGKCLSKVLIRANKRGSIASDLAPILSRLEVEAKSFVAQVCSTAMWIGSVIGRASSCRTEAARCKRRWVVSTARLDG